MRTNKAPHTGYSEQFACILDQMPLCSRKTLWSWKTLLQTLLGVQAKSKEVGQVLSTSLVGLHNKTMTHLVKQSLSFSPWIQSSDIPGLPPLPEAGAQPYRQGGFCAGQKFWRRP